MSPLPSTETRLPPSQPPKPASARTRDRGSSELRLIAAVGEVLARDGFAGLGVNAVAKQACVDKVLIYRYFGGLPELVRAWGGSGSFWPSVAELLGDDPQAVLTLPTAERWTRFLESFIDSLRQRPLTVEILAAEVAAPGELSRILDAEREAWGAEAARVLGGPEFARRPHLNALTLLVILGIQMLIVRSRHTAVFSGIDVQTEAGWAQIKTAVAATARDLFAADPALP